VRVQEAVKQSTELEPHAQNRSLHVYIVSDPMRLRLPHLHSRHCTYTRPCLSCRHADDELVGLETELLREEGPQQVTCRP
jgi:hypothetical protein